MGANYKFYSIVGGARCWTRKWEIPSRRDGHQPDCKTCVLLYKKKNVFAQILAGDKSEDII